MCKIETTSKNGVEDSQSVSNSAEFELISKFRGISQQMIQLWIPLSAAKSVVVDAIKDSAIRLSSVTRRY